MTSFMERFLPASGKYCRKKKEQPKEKDYVLCLTVQTDSQ